MVDDAFIKLWQVRRSQNSKRKEQNREERLRNKNGGRKNKTAKRRERQKIENGKDSVNERRQKWKTDRKTLKKEKGLLRRWKLIWYSSSSGGNELKEEETFERFKEQGMTRHEHKEMKNKKNRKNVCKGKRDVN